MTHIHICKYVCLYIYVYAYVHTQTNVLQTLQGKVLCWHRWALQPIVPSYSLFSRGLLVIKIFGKILSGVGSKNNPVPVEGSIAPAHIAYYGGDVAVPISHFYVVPPRCPGYCIAVCEVPFQSSQRVRLFASVNKSRIEHYTRLLTLLMAHPRMPHISGGETIMALWSSS